jgi:Rrf2 family iron-sulfur cluster assembly transcriptional regulator
MAATPRILDRSSQELYIPAQARNLKPDLSTPAGGAKSKEKRLFGKDALMRLSTKGRYAVMAMADLAGNTGADGENRPVALADIAARQDISLSYLEQLFAKLRRGGLVTSVRGPGGGYRLSRASGDLRIADIILAVDEPISTTRCKTGASKGCTKTGARCVTHDLWEELGQQIHVFLSSVSLADVVERRVLGRSRPCNDTGAIADVVAAE